jgi:hypothetical protein
MQYGIKRLVSGGPKFLELTQDEYEDIKRARNHLLQVLYLEEKFDLLMQNYFEYEMELLRSATHTMLFLDISYNRMQDDMNSMIRQIVNLLSAARLYVDQSVHHLSNIYECNSPKVKQFCDEKSTQYDRLLGYRTMEALRNHVQHRGFPIHSISFPSRWVEGDSKSELSFTSIPQISLAVLEEDRKFKKAVLKELRSQEKLMHRGERIDVRPLMREYIEGLGAVHKKARELLRADEEIWEEKVYAAIKRFEDAFDAKAPITIVALSDDNQVAERTWISEDLIERRKHLERKNRMITTISSRFVTNRPTDTSAS